MNRVRLLAAASAGLLLAACASKAPPPPPPYDPAASAQAQAASFIAADKDAGKHMKAVNKLAVTSCNVMFAQTSSATASTAGGLFSEAGGSKRVEAKVSMYYNLVGVSEDRLQEMTDEICADAETRLKRAGFELVPRDVLEKNESFVELQKAGRPSPFEYKGGGGGAESRYLVFAPGGANVFDERYIGTMSGLGQAFKAAKGTSASQYEFRVMDELQADAVNLNILVDFAEMQSSGTGGSGLASRDNAEVKGNVQLSVTGQLRFKVSEGMKCWERFGKRECSGDPRKFPAFSTARPVLTGEKFYEKVSEATTTGDKVGSALVTGLALLGGGTKMSVTRYNVEVKPETFEAASRRSIDGFMDMVFLTAKSVK